MFRGFYYCFWLCYGTKQGGVIVTIFMYYMCEWLNCIYCSMYHGHRLLTSLRIYLRKPMIWFYYRATLCVRAVCAVARCTSIRLSACLSRSCILSRRLKISSNFFVGPEAPSFQIFYPGASAGAENTMGWENFAIFDWNRRLSGKRYKIGPWLLWNFNSKSYALYRMMTFSMTLTDP